MGYADLADGAVVAEFAYGPFGEPVRATGPMAEALVFRFSTKYTDAETGLLYYGFRYYDPESGRWLSRDPIGETGGVNLYGFVGNDGINAYDYLGYIKIGFLHLEDDRSLLENIGDYFGATASGFGQGAFNAANGFRNAAQGIGQGAALILDPTTRELAYLDIKTLAGALRDDPCLAKILARQIAGDAAQTLSDSDQLSKAIANLSAGGAISILTGSGSTRLLNSVRKLSPGSVIKITDGVAARSGDNIPNFTFRGDTRSPSTIFDQGFAARGDSTDIFLHALDNTSPPSAFIPTSRSLDVASGFADNVFVVRPPYLPG